MRLSWFTGSHLLRQRARRSRRRLTNAALQVRQLERRRVLDGAVQTIVVSAVTSTDTPATTPAATSDTATTTQKPVTFSWAPPPPVSSQPANNADLAQGSALNVPPTLVVPLDQHVNEGQQLNLSGTGGAPPIGLFVDPDLGDTHTGTIDWGDGSAVDNATITQGIGAGTLGGTHTYADQGTYAVTVTVKDNNGGSATQTFHTIVSPVAPTATLGNSGPVNEGSPATVSFANQFDPSSADTAAGFHYAYDVNNDGTFDVGDGTYAGSVTATSANVSASLLANGPSDHTVTARIIDKDGQFTDYTTTIHVLNVAPTLTNITGDSINENQTATIKTQIVDPSATDVFQVQVDWLDGSTATIGGLGTSDSSGTVGNTSYQWTAATRSLQLSHQYLDDGLTTNPTDTYNVSLKVSDNDGDSSGPYTAPVVVHNVAPVLVVAATQNVLEGNTLDLSGTGGAAPLGLFIDPGTLDTHTATVNWGDGSAVEYAALIPGMGAVALGGSHTYADDGTYQVTVTVTDKDGGSDTKSFSVNVGNQNPVVQVPHGNQTITEGGAVNFTDLATFTDPGFDNPSNPNPAVPPNITDPKHESFTYDVNWGDGTGTVTGASVADVNGAPGTPSSGTIGGNHTFADDGTYTVTVTVHDDNGGVGSASFSVNVSNQNPTVLTPHGNQTISEGGAVNFANLATFTDPGFDNPSNPNPAVPPNITDPKNESFTYDINWGDGTGAVTGASVADVNGSPGVPSSGTIGGSHTYADDGTYTVTVTVHDDNGGVGSASFAVTVNNQNPTVLTPHGNQTITEGGTVNFADLATFTDPGFDNPSNPNPAVPPNITDPQHESFTYDVNWGDGTGAVTGASVADVNGGPGTPSSGTIAGSHTYADDGTYTVTVTVHDDNGGVGSASFAVTVNNQNPTVATTHGNQTISEGDTVNFANLATFTDPGFDNPSNPNPAVPPNITDPLHESFTYDVNWGDGTGAVTGASVADANGGPGTPSSGTIGGSHTYADDGTYTVTVTVHDDNGGVGTASFTVAVSNTNPVVAAPNGNQNIFEGDAVSFGNLATFTDAGFDNPANPNSAVPPNITDPKHESFTYDVDWGDGRDAVTGASVSDVNGGPGTPSSGTIGGNHTYADDGTYTVKVTVHDDNGGVGSATFTVTVSNKNPVVMTPHGDQSISEGGTVNFADLATFTDPGFDNPLNPNPASPPQISDPLHESFTYDVNWGDGRDAIAGASIADVNGGPGTPSSGTIAGSHTYADDGDYTVTVTVHDDNGGSSSSSFSVHVANLNPLVSTPNGNQSINEGGTVSFGNLATFTDAGFDNPLNPNPASPPQISDPLHESFTYDVNWGDGRDAITGASVADVNGGPGTPSSGTISGSHTYADDGTYTVTVTVHDDNGGVGVSTFSVTVSNTNPVVTAPHGDQTVLEGDTVNFGDLATFTDAGFDNPANPNSAVPPNITDPLHESFTYDVNWGDGRDAITGASIADVNGSPGTPSSGTIDGSHTYADDGTYTVTVTVHDDNGGVGTATFAVTVNNVAPTVTTPNGDQTVSEGQLLTFGNLATFTDPGSDNPANPNAPVPPNITDPTHESFTYDVNWGDGRDTVTGASVADVDSGPGTQSSGTIGGSHTYADDGTYTVTVTVHDDNGGVGVSTFSVTVNNVAPTVTTSNVDLTVSEGDLLTLPNMATFTDPGFDNPANPNPAVPPNINDPTHESFTYDINWGDGRDPVAGAPVADVDGSPTTPSSGTIGGSHTYADNGHYTVTVTVHDDNGSSNFATFFVTVNNVDPTLRGTNNLQVDEGQSFVLSSDVDPNTKDLNVLVQDPGFDNPLNTNMPPNGGETKETLSAMTIDWGDQTPVVLLPVSINDANRVSGSPGVDTTAPIDAATHTYADNGVYTVKVTIQDDDGPVVERTFTITVNNVPPTLSTVPDQSPPGTDPSLQLREDKTLVLTDLGTITDPGFKNEHNPLSQPGGSDETFHYFVDWGDGTTTDMGTATIDTIGSVGTSTGASFDGSHLYADDGTYTVTVRVADDDMPAFANAADFTNGTNGVDYVEKMFKVTVTDTNPSINTFGGTQVNIAGDTTISGSFSDPGFDNPLNPNAPVSPNITDPHHESFTKVIDWGDGMVDAVHDYASPRDNTMPIVISVTGPGVNQSLSFMAGFGSDDTAVLRLVTRQTVTLPPAQAQDYTFTVDWGNGTVQTFTLKLKDPKFPTDEADTVPPTIFRPSLPPSLQTVVDSNTRLNGNALVNTTGTFGITHTYTAPPDPVHASAPIPITVTIIDDNNGPVSATIEVKNPGIQSINVAIDTTPQVPRLVFTQRQVAQALLDQQTNTPQSLQIVDTRAVSNELAATSHRYLELDVISPDGQITQRYRLRDEALADLRGLIATLPDNHYKIFLVRTDNDSRRLVLDVFVRRGRVVDPSDQSEGTRDRPPEVLPQNQTHSLENNPQLERVPEQIPPGAMNAPATPNEQISAETAPPKIEVQPVAAEGPSSSRLRWAASMAGVGLLAQRGNWARDLDDAFDRADERAWQRLRRAGRRRVSN